MKAKINRCKPKIWKGRYNRLIGNQEAVFKIKFINNRWWPVVTIEGYDHEDRLLCSAVDCDVARELVDIVNSAKKKLSYSEGGSFVINEFGQIIVPSTKGNRERLYVGDLVGILEFENPETKEIFDFGDDGLNVGDRWNRPYLGMKFKLSFYYPGNYPTISAYKDVNEDEQEEIFPQEQDEELIENLIKIRGSRKGCRFIVNHQGVVLTKVEPNWKPVYVGHINYRKWFKKEEY